MSEPAANEPTPRHDVLTQLVRAGLAEHGIGEPTRTEKRQAGQRLLAYAAKHKVPESQLEWATRRAQEEAVAVSRNVSGLVLADMLRQGVRNVDASWVSVMAGAVVGKWELFARVPEHAAGWSSIFAARRRRMRGEKALKAYLPELAASVRGCPDDASDIARDGSPYGANAKELANFIEGLYELTSAEVKLLSESYLTLNAIYNTEFEHHLQVVRDVEDRAVVLGRTWAARRAQAAAEAALQKAEGDAAWAKPPVREAALALVLHDDLDEASFSKLYAACDAVVPARYFEAIDAALVEATERWRASFGSRGHAPTRPRTSADTDSRPTKYLVDPRDPEQVEWLKKRFGLEEDTPRSGH